MADFVLPKSGLWANKVIPSKTTTAYAVGEWLQNDGTDNIPATTSSQMLVGICQEVKAVGTSGTAPLVMRVPVSVDATFEMVTSGTLTAAMVGSKFDLASSTTANQAASSYDPLTLTKFISATLGEYKLTYAMGLNAS